MTCKILKPTMKISQSITQAENPVVQQLADMKDQTEYMKQFRVALGSALDEVKNLRTELAHEKSKGLEILQRKCLQVYQSSTSTIESNEEESSQQTEGSLDHANTNLLVAGLEVHKDISQVIAESAEKIDRVRNGVVARKHQLSELKKKLQVSNSMLIRRESKLEEKINQERQLQEETKQLALELSQFKASDKNQKMQFDKEREHYTHQTSNLLQKVAFLESEITTLRTSIFHKDRELVEARNYLLWSRDTGCGNCAHMKRYVKSLEHELERYRYSGQAYSDLRNIAYHSNYNERGQVQDSAGQHVKNYYYNTSDTSPVSSCNRRSLKPRISHTNRNTAEVYQRQQLANRQRHEFRNASQVLSPISEDAEESLTDQVQEDLTENSACASLASVQNDCMSRVTDVAVAFPSNLSLIKPALDSSPHTSNKTYDYYTVRSPDENVTKPSANNHVVTKPSYLQMSDEKRVSCVTKGNTEAGVHILQPDIGHSVGVDRQNSLLFEKDKANIFPLQTQVPVSVAFGNVKGSSSDGPMTNTNRAIEKYNFTHCSRSFPSFPASLSPTPSSILSTTEDNTSDTAGCCSSDSGILSRSESHKRFVKTRRSGKRKSQRFVKFRGHTIDVTRFSMLEFRQIMWSVSSQDNASDDFLNFLAAEASRLQKDNYWANKHTLGDPDDWLKLKGSY
ncbi:unnamed protein product [Clavelina lepadiformis]|uniref:Uncharacterized protein n=2 Tax=Clavelina lepadiformis TaxID=159417 RepID=A0ABP0G2M0_CLALP